MRCFLALWFVFSAAVHAADASGISVHDGYVRLPPPGSPAAAYFVLRNTGVARALVDAECGCADMTMIHESQEKDGMVRMRHVDSAAIPSGSELALTPGGLHVMMMGLHAPLKLGDTVTLTLHFADGASLAVALPVQAR